MNDEFFLKGRVKLHRINEKSGEKELIVDTKNTIVYQGREAVWPHLFLVDNQNIASRYWYGLYYVGLGNGGVYDVNNPMSRKIVQPYETSLYSPIQFGPSAITTPNLYYRLITPSYAQDPTNGYRYLIAFLNVIVSANEMNGEYISEAGLFLANSNNPLVATDFVLFAKTTFPPQYKTNDYSWSLDWLLYC